MGRFFMDFSRVSLLFRTKRAKCPIFKMQNRTLFKPQYIENKVFLSLCPCCPMCPSPFCYIYKKIQKIPPDIFPPNGLFTPKKTPPTFPQKRG